VVVCAPFQAPLVRFVGAYIIHLWIISVDFAFVYLKASSFRLLFLKKELRVQVLLLFYFNSFEKVILSL
jgi:hypothetical protein